RGAELDLELVVDAAARQLGPIECELERERALRVREREPAEGAGIDEARPAAEPFAAGGLTEGVEEAREGRRQRGGAGLRSEAIEPGRELETVPERRFEFGRRHLRFEL